jgi:hypothetical protein
MNQQKLSSNLKAQYDFVACGSGSSGSVVARRLADNPDVSVLLLEAGGGDDISEVMEADQWPMNLGSERDWSFQTQPNSNLDCRSIQLPMGKGTFEHGRSDRVGVRGRFDKNRSTCPAVFWVQDSTPVFDMTIYFQDRLITRCRVSGFGCEEIPVALVAARPGHHVDA